MVQIEACQAKGDSECVREAQAPTMERKIRELRYAIAMEKKFTKDQILERYLNIAYYGEGAYGVEAAARHYFSTQGLQAHAGAGGDAGRTGAEPGYATIRCATPAPHSTVATSCSTGWPSSS